MKSIIIKTLFFAVFFFGIFGLAKNSQAATNFYVAKGVCSSSCDGTTWAKAWDDLDDIDWVAPGNVVAGDTVYVGTGTYAPLNIGASGSVGSPITIQKATVESRGSDTGWNDDWAAAAYIGKINYGNYDYVVVDGMFRYGFIVNIAWVTPCTSTTGTPSGAVFGTTSNHDTLRYVNIDGNGGKESTEGIYSLNGTNNTVQYCWIHDTANDAMKLLGSGHVLDNNIFGPLATDLIATACCSGVVCHADMVEVAGQASNITFKNNLIQGSNDGIIFLAAGSGSDSWYIYNNIFTNSISKSLGGTMVTIKSGGGITVTNVHIYNNTAYNLYGGFNQGDQTFTIHNNLFYLVTTYKSDTGDNITADTNPFFAEGDYHLNSTSQAALQVGTSFVSPYNYDRDGVARNATPWVGAYEYISGADITPPAAPTGLSVN